MAIGDFFSNIQFLDDRSVWTRFSWPLKIAHSYAGDINLTLTANKLIEIIQRAQREQLKVACFVTGVPGAGKTLAGLNVVHNPALRQEGQALLLAQAPKL